MEIVLAIATLLGGGSAIWFFWDKLSATFCFSRFSKEKTSSNILSLPDKEFSMLEKISSFPANNNFTPTSDNEISLCNSLVNYGWLKNAGNTSYKLTKKGKKANA